MFGVDYAPRRWLDWVGIGVTGGVLVALVGLGLYGSFLGFLQTKTYLHANDWVALGAGLLGAGCALYLLMEANGRLETRQVLAICVVSFLFSVFAVTKGAPAALTEFTGRPTAVWFTVTRFDPGSKSCPRTVVAEHADYEDLRICVKGLNAEPRIGRLIEVRGMRSPMGVVRSTLIVR